MFFSILFTYPKSENQILVLACNEGIQCAPKYFVIPLPPSPLFLTLCLVFAFTLQVFVVEQFGIQRWKANGKNNLMLKNRIKNRTPTV